MAWSYLPLRLVDRPFAADPEYVYKKDVRRLDRGLVVAEGVGQRRGDGLIREMVHSTIMIRTTAAKAPAALTSRSN